MRLHRERYCQETVHHSSDREKAENLRSHLSLQPTPTPHMYGNLLQTAGPRQREPLKFASNQRINTLPVSAMAF